MADLPQALNVPSSAAPAAAGPGRLVPEGSPIALFEGGPITLRSAAAVLAPAKRGNGNGNSNSTPAAGQPSQRTANANTTTTTNSTNVSHTIDTATNKAGGKGRAAASPAAAAVVGARVAMGPSALMAAQLTDPRQWVLALRRPPQQQQQQPLPSQVAAAADSTPSVAVVVVALEEKLTLADLKMVMQGFASRADATDEERLAGIDGQAETRRNNIAAAAGNKCKHSPRTRGQYSSGASSPPAVGEEEAAEEEGEEAGPPLAADGKPAVHVALPVTPGLTAMLLGRPAADADGGGGSSSDGSPSGVKLTPASSLAAAAAGASPPRSSSAAASPGPHRAGISATSFDRVLTEDEFIALMKRVLAASATGHARAPAGGGGSSCNTSGSGGKNNHRHNRPPTATSRVVSPERDASASPARPPANAQPPPPQALLLALTSPSPPSPSSAAAATEREIRLLLNKVDYEGSGLVTWNELATFFISQSRHRAHLWQMSVQYTERAKPPVATTGAAERHQRAIVCACVDPSGKVRLTGGRDGTVRAWAAVSLAYRGLIFAAPDASWIVGVHYGCLGRLIYIVTLGRRVYVLDAVSFEVLVCYQGRAVDDSPASAVYAHETTRAVLIGGMGVAGPSGLPAVGGSGGATSSSSSGGRRARTTGRPTSARPPPPPASSSAKAALPLRVSAVLTAAAVMTTATAYETLDLDRTALTARGTGPYVERRIAENAIIGLADAVTASAYCRTALDEDALLLGTAAGDVLIVIMAPRHGIAGKRVLVPKHSLELHRGRLNKLELLPALDALVTCGDDGRVVMTSMVTGTTLREFFAPGFPGQHVAVRDFGIDGPLRMMVTVGPERRALVWDFAQFNPIAVLDAHGCPCLSCAIVATPDTGDGGASAAAVAAAARRSSNESEAGAAAAAAASKGAVPVHFVTAGIDGSIQIFDTSGFHCVHSFTPIVTGKATSAAAAAAAAAATATSGGDEDSNSGGSSKRKAADGSDAAAAAAATTITASLRATESDHVAQLIVSDAKRRSIVCFSRYAFRLSMRRQVTASCPARYHGPLAPMLSTMHTRGFDVLVTVDTAAVAMTWNRVTGKNVFSFSLGDFSDSAAMNATQLTAVALDGLQRRMLTGFRNGAVVVWNVANGQVVNFITAGIPGEGLVHAGPDDDEDKVPEVKATQPLGGAAAHAAKSTVTAATASAAAASGQSHTSTDSPRKARMRAAALVNMSNNTKTTTTNTTAGSSEVNAVASLIRHGSVFIVFAIRNAVYVVQEDPSSFTIATVNYGVWRLPEAYGEVNALAQVSPQSMACGTSSGALLFFHVMSGLQEGAALWVRETSGAATSSTSHNSHASVNGGGGGGYPWHTHPAAAAAHIPVGRAPSAAGDPLPPPSPQFQRRLSRSSVATTTTTSATSVAVLTSRIVKLLPLPNAHPHLLLSVHADGVVALWHTLRRVFLGSVNLTAVGGGGGASEAGKRGAKGCVSMSSATDVNGSSAPASVVVDVNWCNDLLVFGDSRGRLHVCELSFRPLPLGSPEERAALAMPNPAWYTAQATPVVAAAAAVFGDVDDDGSVSALAAPATTGEAEEKTADDQQEAGASSVPAPQAATSETAAATHTTTTTTAQQAERQIVVIDRFTRVRAFATGLLSVGSVSVIDPTARSASAVAQPGQSEDTEQGSGNTATATPPPPTTTTTTPTASNGSGGAYQTVVFCSSAESQYARLFTLEGIPIGEPGMDPWQLGDERTYRYMGERLESPPKRGRRRRGQQQQPPATGKEEEVPRAGLGPLGSPTEMSSPSIHSSLSAPLSAQSLTTSDRDQLPPMSATFALRDSSVMGASTANTNAHEDDEDNEDDSDGGSSYDPDACFFDYLADGYAAHQEQAAAMMRARANSLCRGSRASTAAAAARLRRSSLGLTLAPRLSCATPTTTAAAASASATATGVGPVAPILDPALPTSRTPTPEAATTATGIAEHTTAPALLAAPLKRLYNTGTRATAAGIRRNGAAAAAATAAAEDSGGDDDNHEALADAASSAPDATVPLPLASDAQLHYQARLHQQCPISTLMTRNTKEMPAYGKVLKRTYAHQVRLERRLRKQQEEGEPGADRSQQQQNQQPINGDGDGDGSLEGSFNSAGVRRPAGTVTFTARRDTAATGTAAGAFGSSAGTAAEAELLAPEGVGGSPGQRQNSRLLLGINKSDGDATDSKLAGATRGRPTSSAPSRRPPPPEQPQQSERPGTAGPSDAATTAAITTTTDGNPSSPVGWAPAGLAPSGGSSAAGYPLVEHDTERQCWSVADEQQEEKGDEEVGQAGGTPTAATAEVEEAPESIAIAADTRPTTAPHHTQGDNVSSGPTAVAAAAVRRPPAVRPAEWSPSILLSSPGPRQQQPQPQQERQALLILPRVAPPTHPPTRRGTAPMEPDSSLSSSSSSSAPAVKRVAPVKGRGNAAAAAAAAIARARGGGGVHYRSRIPGVGTGGVSGLRRASRPPDRPPCATFSPGRRGSLHSARAADHANSTTGSGNNEIDSISISAAAVSIVSGADVSFPTAAAASPEEQRRLVLLGHLEHRRLDVLRNVGLAPQRSEGGTAGSSDQPLTAAMESAAARFFGPDGNDNEGGGGGCAKGGAASAGVSADAGTAGLHTTTAPVTTTSARSLIAAVSARLYVAPVEHLEPPLGSRSREDAMAWRGHVQRLQQGGGGGEGGGQPATTARKAGGDGGVGRRGK